MLHYIESFTTLETHSFVPGWQAIKFLENEVYSVYCAESGESMQKKKKKRGGHHKPY